MPRKKQQPTPVHIPKTDPKYLQYWNKSFKNFNFWYDWQAFVQTCNHQIPNIMEQCETNYNEARAIGWTSVGEAYEGDEKSPMIEEWQKFILSIEAKEVMLLLCHFQIGTDIKAGNTESQAKKHYIQWLWEDVENAIWTDYALSDDFKIIDATEYLDSIEVNSDGSRKKPQKGKRKKK